MTATTARISQQAWERIIPSRLIFQRGQSYLVRIQLLVSRGAM
jgi:hypothetical protein